MKTKKYIALLGVCATVLLTAGCNDNEPLTPHEQTIVGKWVQVASALTEDSKEGEYDVITFPGDDEEFRYPQVITFEPNEEYYLEFLPNRKIRYGASFDINGECRDCDCDCIYKMDEKYLYVYYDRKIYGPDGDSDTIDKYIFSENNNELKLVYVKGLLEEIFPQYLVKIYKRIN